MTLTNGVRGRIFGDYLFARSKIDFLLFNPGDNKEVVKYGYREPETRRLETPLKLNHKKGEFAYYCSLRDSLEGILAMGYAKQRIEKFNPPEYIIKLIREF